ncbi:MAG: hypothetical protein IJY36_02450 [Coprobacter sp.]|nr:hypothetical protein [Coprobacter sp.]
MKIEKLGGTTPRLYALIAPLALNATVIRQNNNSAFKTSERHEWLVAIDEEADTAIAFFPMEQRNGYIYVNNYYVPAENENNLLTAFIKEVKSLYGKECPILVAAHARHADLFVKKGFTMEKEWKLYIKMKYAKADGKAQERV